MSKDLSGANKQVAKNINKREGQVKAKTIASERRSTSDGYVIAKKPKK